MPLLIVSLLGVASAQAGYQQTGPNVTPVRFGVTNVNRTGVVPQCTGDRHPYTVAGTLVVPASARSAVTVFVHGAMNGGPWHFTTVAGHDDVAAFAGLGHASLALDLLGYGASDIPDGRDVCQGSEATILSEVAQQLRLGTYTTADGSQPRRFASVALAGISMSGHIAEITAWAFADSYDAFILSGWSQSRPQERIIPVLRDTALMQQRCTMAPQEKRPGESSGYARLFDGDDTFVSLAYNVDASVLDAFRRQTELDACGISATQGNFIAASIIAIGQATKPILILLGDHDLFTSPDDYASRFTGSDDVSWFVAPNAGHLWMIGGTAQPVTQVVADWLSARGL